MHFLTHKRLFSILLLSISYLEQVSSLRSQPVERLSGDDISELIDSQPEVIIAGTGVSGLVNPEKELQKRLQKMSIEFLSAPNQKAMELFNELSSKKRAGACFLTC